MTSPEKTERVETRGENARRWSWRRLGLVALILILIGGILGYGLAWRETALSTAFFLTLLLPALMFWPSLLAGSICLWLCVPRFAKNCLLVVAGLAAFTGSFLAGSNLRWSSEFASLEDYVEESLAEFEGDAAWLQLRLMARDAPLLVQTNERRSPTYVEIIRDTENFEKAKRVVIHSESFFSSSATFELKDGKWTRSDNSYD